MTKNGRKPSKLAADADRSTGQIIVLGMHRSGTSCVGNLLHALGAHYADSSVNNAAADENPKGFWEHPAVREVCDQLLQSSGHDWWSIDDFRPDAVPSDVLAEAQQKFSALVGELDLHQPWFIKEPRLCFLLPLLMPAMTRPVAIHVWRHPLEVAASLHTRNGFSLDFGVALWEAYVRSAFKVAEGIPAVMVDYGSLLRQPMLEVGRLLEKLAEFHIRGVAMPSPERLTEAIDQSLQRSGRSGTVHDFLSPEQLDLLQALENGDHTHPVLRLKLSRAATIRLAFERERTGLLLSLQMKAASKRELESIGRRLAPLADAAKNKDIALLHEDLNKIRSEIQGVRSDLRKNDADYQALGTDLRSSSRAVILLGEDIRKIVQGFDAQLGALKTGFGSQLVALRENGSNSRNEIAKLSDRIARYASYIESRDKAVADRDERIRKAAADLVAKDQRINQLSLQLQLERLPFYARWAGGKLRLDDAPETALPRRNKLTLYLYYLLRHWRRDAAVLAEIAASGLFDNDWYLKENGDVARAGHDPLLHYVNYGWREGRDPGPEFQTSYYLATNADVSRAGVNPLLHYIRYGRAERRLVVMPARGIATGPIVTAKPSTAPAASARPRVVIYTAVAGGYDELKIPEIRSGRCDFVCLTDRNIPGDRGWLLRPMDYLASEPVRAARYAKTHPHAYFPDHDWSIWVDANLLIRGDLTELVDTVERNKELFSTFIHPHRDCLYAEATEILQRKLDDPERVNSQAQRYKNAGYPPTNGLSETNVLVRRHNDPRVIAINTDWWREIDNGSHRDQLSLNYVAHKRRFKIGALAKRGVSVRNDARITRFLHGNDSKYHLPGSIDNAANQGNHPFWESRQGAGLIAPQDLDTYDSISVDIVVCVFNGLADVRRCLESVAEHLRPNQRIIVVDDGSDAETEQYCKEFVSRISGTLLVRRPHGGSGYTKAANNGIKESSADYVILLNSDTVVTRSWVSKLVQAGESAPDIGLIGPMSNAASWQSMPETSDGRGDLAVNEIPRGCTIQHMDQCCELWSQAPLFPRVSLLNGFCLAVKRRVLDTIGLFDEVAFPHGYGEENDYCFRAGDAGFGLVVATHTYVFHAKSKSYSHERRRELAKASGVVFRDRYGAERIARAVASTRDNPYLERLRNAARQLWPADGSQPGAGLKVLFLLPVIPGGGGVHSVIQEVNGLCALGAEARVAVPRIYREDYVRAYAADRVAIITYYDSVDDLIELAKSFQVVVATAFNSMDLLERIMATHCALLPAYYIQDYEPFFFDKSTTARDRERFVVATRSYTAIPDLLRFAKTAWLQRVVEEKAGGRTYKVLPSIDRDIYFPPEAIPGEGPVRIVAMVRLNSPRRSPKMTMRVLARIAQAHGTAVSIHVFGSAPNDLELQALRGDAPITCHGVLRREQVSELLRHSDIFVDFSEYQAFGRTALEAMACGCVAVVPRAGGADEYARDGYNARVADTGAEDACLQALDELVGDSAQRARLRECGLETAARYSVAYAAASELILFRSALTLRADPVRTVPVQTAPAAASTTLQPPSGTAVLPSKATPGANQYLEPELSMFDISPEELESNKRFVASMRKLQQVPTDTLLWFLPSFDHIYRGGIRTIFMVADHLARTRGSKNIFVIYGNEKAPLAAINTMATSAFPELKAQFIRLADGESPQNLPPADAAFATLWTSAYLLAKYNQCRAKYYFMQDFEPSFYPAGSVYGVIEQTYLLGFHGIANTVGVAQKYRRYSEWVDFFTPGVDSALYHPGPRNTKDPLRIVFYGRPNNNRNAFNLGIESLRLVKKQYGHKVDIVSVGGMWPEHRYAVRGIVRNAGVLPTMEEVAALYRSSDMGLVFMFSDHPSYQPLEFMASGCCTVTNFNPSTTWLLRDGENAFLPGAAPVSVARCIIDALGDPESRRRVIDGGLRTVRELRWEIALNRITNFIASPHPVNGDFDAPFPGETPVLIARKATF